MATVGTIQTSFSMHSKAFDDFQNSRGVKTFVGSIGPIDNVRMMVGYNMTSAGSPLIRHEWFTDEERSPCLLHVQGVRSRAQLYS